MCILNISFEIQKLKIKFKKNNPSLENLECFPLQFNLNDNEQQNFSVETKNQLFPYLSILWFFENT